MNRTLPLFLTRKIDALLNKHLAAVRIFRLLIFALVTVFFSLSHSETNFQHEHIYNEGDLGELLNIPGQTPADIRQAEIELQKILDVLTTDDPKAIGFEWRIEIRSSTQPYMGTQLYQPTDENESLRKFHQVSGLKPMAQIVVSTALLSQLKTKSQLAFVLGHEITHNTEGHTESDHHGIKELFARQSHEVAADKGSIDRMLGKFSLEGAHSALSLLVQIKERMEPRPRTSLAALDAASDALAEDHHHPGLRLALIRQYIDQIGNTPAGSQQIIDEKIPSSLHFLSKKYHDQMPLVLVDQLTSFQDYLKKSSGNNLDEAFQKLIPILEFFPRFLAYSDSAEKVNQILSTLQNSRY
jgi:hypothetical protein